jgi:hypothetical protein
MRQEKDQTTPQLRRGSLGAKAEKARRLAENPDIKRLFVETRESIIASIERITLDGSVERENAVLELVRQLQCMTELRRTMLRPIAQEQLEESRKKRA